MKPSRIPLHIKFEPRDIWVGIFWDRSARLTTLETDRQIYTVYVCIVPCFPIIFQFSKKYSAHQAASELVNTDYPDKV